MEYLNELVTFPTDEFAGEHLSTCHQCLIVLFVHHFDDGFVIDVV